MFPLFELVAIGGIIFWILVGGVVAALVAAVDRDEPFVASVLTVGTLVFLALFTTFNPFLWLWANSGLVLLLAVAYVIIGILYSGLKWLLWNYSISRKLKEYKPGWVKANPRRIGDLAKAHGYRDGEEESLASYEERFFYEAKRRLDLPSDELSPRVSQNKSRIMTWMVYWPFSAAWTLLNDPIRHLYNLIYAWMGGTLQAISDRVYRDVRMTEADK